MHMIDNPDSARRLARAIISDVLAIRAALPPL